MIGLIVASAVLILMAYVVLHDVSSPAGSARVRERPDAGAAPEPQQASGEQPAPVAPAPQVATPEPQVATPEPQVATPEPQPATAPPPVAPPVAQPVALLPATAASALASRTPLFLGTPTFEAAPAIAPVPVPAEAPAPEPVAAAAEAAVLVPDITPSEEEPAPKRRRRRRPERIDRIPKRDLLDDGFEHRPVYRRPPPLAVVGFGNPHLRPDPERLIQTEVIERESIIARVGAVLRLVITIGIVGAAIGGAAIGIGRFIAALITKAVGKA